MLLEGIFAPITTPFYADERLYFRKIEANMARYSRSLLAGMAVLGSTGEAVMLDDAESRDVLRVAAEATAPEKSSSLAWAARASRRRSNWPKPRRNTNTTLSSSALPVTMPAKCPLPPCFTTFAA